jgi:hypothetical protein
LPLVTSAEQQRIISGLDRLSESPDLEKEKFIDVVFDVLEPLIILRSEQPEIFEAQARIAFNEKFIPINQLLSYEISRDEKSVHIHIAPNKTTEQKGNLLMEGLQILANILKEKENEDIGTVVATSWFVAKHPRFMTGLGFTVDGPIDKKTRKDYFADDPRAVSRSHMSRTDFLAEHDRSATSQEGRLEESDLSLIRRLISNH